MKLFNTILSASIILLSITNLNAQGFYIGASGGYAFGIATTDRLLVNEGYYNGLGYVESYQIFETEDVSLGKGWSFGATIGYMFNKHIGVEVLTSYLIGGKTTSKLEHYQLTSTDSPKYLGGGTSTMYSRMLRVIPTFVLTPGFEKINPYMKLGVVFGMGEIQTNQELDGYNQSGNKDFNSQIVNRGGLAFGLNAVLGVNYPISEKLSVFSELSLISMSYSPEFGYYEDSNGKTKDIIYSDEVTNGALDYFFYTDEFPNSLKESHPFSTMGVNLGIIFNLKN